MPHTMTCHPQNDEASRGNVFSRRRLSGPYRTPCSLTPRCSKCHLASRALILRRILFLRTKESHHTLLLKQTFGSGQLSTFTL